jgi:small GTP-binding protein
MINKNIVKCNNCGVKNKITSSYSKNKRPICGRCSEPLSLFPITTLNDVKEELKKIRNYTPKIGVFGDTGAGKSSLCNALFRKKIAPTSDVEACTREPQNIFISNENGGGINLIDVPGVGEDSERHKEYIELYKNLSLDLDLILWVLKADDRKYMSAIDVYQKILKPNIENTPVLFVINQIDKIEPVNEWYESGKNKLGKNQKKNLDRKIKDVSSVFKVDEKYITYTSTIKGTPYLKSLVSKIIEVLPNEKKFSFAREAKEENLTKETARKAEESVWEYIKNKAGDAWDSIKDSVAEVAIDGIKKYAPILMGAAYAYFKKKM